MRSSVSYKLSSSKRSVTGRKRSGGFTLAEVLVALLVLAAGLAMAANVLIKSNQTSARSRDLTSATLIARTQLDRMMEAPFPELISDRFERSGKVKQGPVTFSWSAELQEVNPELTRIRLSVAWQARGGINKHEFTCIRSK